jgi:6-phosphogluconolactonase
MKPTLLPLATALLVCLALAALSPAGSPPVAHEVTLYAGTYTEGGESQGIYRLRFDTATGALSKPELAATAENPSFLVQHPNGRFVYAANEWAAAGADKAGTLSAFAVEADGRLTFLNKQPAGGSAPCHLEMTSQGTHLMTANYGGGNAAVFPLGKDGTLGDATALVQHKGKGPKPNQEAPHAHAIVLDRAERYAFVADLGIDQIVGYRFDATHGTLAAHKDGTVALPPGSGPRHFVFDAKGRHAYVITEMASAVTAFDYDASRGRLTARGTVSTLPKDFTGETDGAEIAISPDGKFLYASNRGRDPKVADTIAIFGIDAKTGALAAVGHQSLPGRTPRHFAFDPSGRFLLVAHQRSSSVAVFRVDAAAGTLTPVGEPVSVPKPVCLLFARKP